MAAALAVSGVGYWLAQQRPQPVLAPKFDIPTKTAIDTPLVAGSALFGIGWGLVGLCPGPALENLATLSPQVIVFCVAMAVGMVAHDHGTPSGGSTADGALAAPTARPRTRHHLPAVDDDRRAGDEAAGVGRQQQQRAVEVARLAEAADRNVALDRRAALAFEIVAVQLGDDPARRDGVDADALERELERQRLGELDHAGLRHRIGARRPSPRSSPSIEAMLTIAPPLPAAIMRRAASCDGEEHRVEIGAEHAPPFLLGQLDRAARHAPRRRC